MINGGALNTAPVNAPHGAAFVDWAANLDPLTTQNYFALDIADGVTTLRIPMSSWQATLQLDRSNFVQAVIPAALEYLAAINALTGAEIIISRGVRYEDDTTQEAELARAPLTTARYQQGPTRATITVSGYGTTDPPAANVRTMRDVRSLTVDSGVRVRCAIDWFLRPGQTAVAAGRSFTVSYINYYANSFDQYMDIGERAL